MSLQHEGFSAQQARWQQERSAAKARIAAVETIGSEWSDAAGTSFAIVTPSPARPGWLAVRWFDARGFSGHQMARGLNEVSQELMEFLGQGVTHAPGALERMAPGFAPLTDWIVIHRPRGDVRAPWTWHGGRFYASPQAAHSAALRIWQDGQDALTETLPPETLPIRAHREAAARALVDTKNAGLAGENSGRENR